MEIEGAYTSFNRALLANKSMILSLFHAYPSLADISIKV
jgi:hypothetical protein